MRVMEEYDKYLVVLSEGELEDVDVLEKINCLKQKGKVAIVVSGVEAPPDSIRRLLENMPQ